MAHETRQCGGSSGSDVVILGALPDGDEVGHYLTAAKSRRPGACLAADVLYGLDGVMLHMEEDCDTAFDQVWHKAVNYLPLT